MSTPPLHRAGPPAGPATHRRATHRRATIVAEVNSRGAAQAAGSGPVLAG